MKQKPEHQKQAGGQQLPQRIRMLPGSRSEFTNDTRYPLYTNGEVVFENPHQVFSFFASKYGSGASKAYGLLRGIAYDVSMDGMKALIKKSESIVELQKNVESGNYQKVQAFEDPVMKRPKKFTESHLTGSDRLELQQPKMFRD